MYASQQSGHRKAVAAHGLRGALQAVDSLSTALQQGGQLVGQRHGNTAQAPCGGQARRHAGVKQHRRYSFEESWRRECGICGEVVTERRPDSNKFYFKSNIGRFCSGYRKWMIYIVYNILL